jgi:hypothetical protein
MQCQSDEVSKYDEDESDDVMEILCVIGRCEEERARVQKDPFALMFLAGKSMPACIT